MSDLNKYTDYSFVLAGTAAPYEKGSLELGNEKNVDGIRSGGALRDDLRQVVKKKPFMRATLLDPSLVTEWQKVGAGETITSVMGVWRAFDSFGGLGASYISAAMSLGVIMPVSLSAAPDRKASLEVMAMAAFSGGTAMTIGTTSDAGATVAKAFYPTNIIIGSDTIVALRSVQVNWEYQVQDDEQHEPEYWYYDAFDLRGTAGCRRVDKVTAARLEDGVRETCSVLLTDANNGANTVSVSLGTCSVFGTIRGDEASLEFEKVGA